jgi:acetyl esterase/lipase
MNKYQANKSAPMAIEPDKDVVFSTPSGIELHGSIRLPKDSSQSLPAVLIISGSGPVDRDGNAPNQAGLPQLKLDVYNWLADILTAQGIASLRYDKVTSGATGLGPYASSPSSLVTHSFEQIFVEPAQSGLQYLAKQPGVDPEKIIILGHSEGGLIAMLLASQAKSSLLPQPAGLVLAEPSYGRFLDIVARQLVEQINQTKIDSNEKKSLISWVNAGVTQIRENKAGFADTQPPQPPLLKPSKEAQQWQDMVASIVYQRMQNLLIKSEDALDPCKIAASLSLPTLITAGSKDFNTPPVTNGPAGSGVWALAQAFKPKTTDIFKYVELKNVVHILRDIGSQDASTMPLTSQIEYPYSAQFSSELEAFMAKFS